MTVTEAIEHQENRVASPFVRANEKSRAAMQMGIEAMKFFKDLRDRGALPADVRLPGETKE